MCSNIRILKAVPLELYERIMSQVHPSPSSSSSIYNPTQKVMEYDLGLTPSTFLSPPVGEQSNDKESGIIKLVPKRQQSKASGLLRMLSESNLTWNDHGEIILNGNTVTGSNIVDLISAATAPNKMRNVNLSGLDQFVSFVRKFNIPKHLLGSDFLKLMDKKPSLWTTYENTGLVESQ